MNANAFKVYLNQWPVVMVSAVGLVLGVLIALGAGNASGGRPAAGLAVIGLSLLLLAFARRPQFEVDEEGVSAHGLGQVLFDEIESVAPYRFVGYQGLVVRLKPTPTAGKRLTMLGRFSLAIIRPFFGPAVFLRCDGFGVSWVRLYKPIRRGLKKRDRRNSADRPGVPS